MSASQLTDYSKLCIHTFTNKPWTIEQIIDKYSKAGVKGITVWRNAVEGRNVATVGNQIRNAGLSIVSLCRGGFFPAKTQADRQKAIDENLHIIDEAKALGAPLIVLVCGAVPGLSLEENRKQISDGIGAILPHAKASGVKLAIEPLHPMYAGDRCAVNTMAQATDICRQHKSDHLGIALDVYHVWWDNDLKNQIEISGREKTLFAFHICDWKTPTLEFLNDRGLMGEGCIPIRQIRGWVEETGFNGFNEVEIFSNIHWAEDQDTYLASIQKAYLQHS